MKLFLTYAYYLAKSIVNRIVFHLPVKRYPEVVNFAITNTCNCRCKMCNVWDPDNVEHFRVSAEDIKNIFSSNLFKKVKYVGLTGGEPFIREDIEEIVGAIIEKVPSLRGVSIISNGILTDRIKNIVPRIRAKCREREINFSIMLSIDGIGELHDRIRGVDGSYASLTETMHALDKMNEKYSFCATIVKDNIDHLHEILNFARSRNIYIKFRLATKIDRLINDVTRHIFSFTREEKIKIAKFMNMLRTCYEDNLNRKIFYRSIVDQIIYGKKRLAGCHWKNIGISVDPEGGIYYCAVNSPKIGDLMDVKGASAYFDKINVRRRIIRDKCDSCVHDYTGIHDPVLIFKSLFDFLKPVLVQIGYYALYVISPIIVPLVSRMKIKRSLPLRQVFITGWYGTETLGDKAILAGLIDNLRSINKEMNIVVSSISPYYTEETLCQIDGSNDHTVIRKNIIDTFRAIVRSEAVIFGGGPFMDMEQMNDVLFTFLMARALGKRTIAYGCGLGPLHAKRMKLITRYILMLAGLTIFRGEKSVLKHSDMLFDLRYFVGTDLSITYLLRQGEYDPGKSGDAPVLVAIRDWPVIYCDNKDKYVEIKQRFLDVFFKFIKNEFLDKKIKVVFFPMHTFYIGGDDRLYFKDIQKHIGEHPLVEYFYPDCTLDDAVRMFKGSRMVIGMRYHSIVFGCILGIPTLAIDYDAKGGKAAEFCDLIERNDVCVNIKDISYDRLHEISEKIKKYDKNGSDIMRSIITGISSSGIKKFKEYLSR